MEEMKTNENVAVEAIEEIKDAIPTGKNGLKTAAKIGLAGATTIAVWEFGVKRLFRWGKNKFAAKKASGKTKKAKADEIDLDDMELDEVPEIGK